jgi:D-arabinose 1-dehydrogenase-like Zn-dependent alcohol dehydrogenase
LLPLQTGDIRRPQESAPLAAINTVLSDLKRGSINGRIVLDLA